MPQASKELRRRWGGQDGIGEDKASAFLKSHGWTERAMGLWDPNKPRDQISPDEWDALAFLCDEWDHDLYQGPSFFPDIQPWSLARTIRDWWQRLLRKLDP